ncbi:Gtr1/RagA G protein Gtr2 [Saitoella complicata NRRL Y-17804]|nr:Gtr1/RagA G protein Gtr2 [Saitoella complicata NRRL Y-17804]ODQ54762.1 Gtr1/RagA G protein Gtr2 [Saitoella complicata NRRL Y-17804]
MGLRRCGKSSIQKVVFHKMPPNETLFLESTSKITKDNINSFIDFQVWDFPGQIDFFDPTFDADSIFGEIGALIFIIDAQDDYLDALQKLHVTITRALAVNPNIHLEVFIHKVDGLSDDYKIDTQRDIQQRTSDELADVGLDNVTLNFHLTSIYDHSIFEAFSKVIQKLIPQLPTLENLLNILCSNSGIEKAYLFDVLSKIYIATDSSPVDMQSYEICSDFIDVVIDVSTIYGYDRPTPSLPPTSTSTTTPTDPDSAGSIIKLSNGLVLYLREINRYLALICLMRSEALDKHGLVEWNVGCFQKAIEEVFDIEKRSGVPTPGGPEEGGEGVRIELAIV